MALTETQLKICRFHGSLSQKGSRPLVWSTRHLHFRPFQGKLWSYASGQFCKFL